MFRVILFVLVLLVCSFAESKVKLSKKYIPYSNPGGKDFNDDEEFAKLYKLYEKRRLALKEKKTHPVQLKNRNHSNHQNGCIVKDTQEDAMVNKHGIDLARLKGAIFINQNNQITGDQAIETGNKAIEEDRSTENLKKNQVVTQEQAVEELDEEDGQEKKISAMNVTIKDPASRRRICSHEHAIDRYLHDSIIDE